MKRSALILIDLQNDFLPGGALGVTSGNEVIPIANQLLHQFDFIVATQDWHPQNHISFASRYPEKKLGDTLTLHGKMHPLWPDHCVQNTPGAELSAELDMSGIDHIVHKGTHADIHSYSAFFDNDPYHATGLHTLFKFHKIKKIYILGLSVGSSIEHTTLDALNLGYQVFVLMDACRSLNTASEESNESIVAQLAGTKAKLINSAELHTMPKQVELSFGEE